jgi:hypothetical protein
LKIFFLLKFNISKFWWIVFIFFINFFISMYSSLNKNIKKLNTPSFSIDLIFINNLNNIFFIIIKIKWGVHCTQTSIQHNKISKLLNRMSWSSSYFNSSILCIWVFNNLSFYLSMNKIMRLFTKRETHLEKWILITIFIP